MRNGHLKAVSKRLNKTLNETIKDNTNMVWSHVTAKRLKDFLENEDNDVAAVRCDLQYYFEDIAEITALELNMAYMAGVGDCMTALGIPEEKMDEVVEKISEL